MYRCVLPTGLARPRSPSAALRQAPGAVEGRGARGGGPERGVRATGGAGSGPRREAVNGLAKRAEPDWTGPTDAAVAAAGRPRRLKRARTVLKRVIRGPGAAGVAVCEAPGRGGGGRSAVARRAGKGGVRGKAGRRRLVVRRTSEGIKTERRVACDGARSDTAGDHALRLHRRFPPRPLAVQVILFRSFTVFSLKFRPSLKDPVDHVGGVEGHFFESGSFPCTERHCSDLSENWVTIQVTSSSIADIKSFFPKGGSSPKMLTFKCQNLKNWKEGYTNTLCE